jgi:hypothetical protein
MTPELLKTIIVKIVALEKVILASPDAQVYLSHLKEIQEQTDLELSKDVDLIQASGFSNGHSTE